MIRRLLAQLAGRTSSRPTSRQGCTCHPDFHDLGVHAPDHLPEGDR